MKKRHSAEQIVGKLRRAGAPRSPGCRDRRRSPSGPPSSQAPEPRRGAGTTRDSAARRVARGQFLDTAYKPFALLSDIGSPAGAIDQTQGAFRALASMLHGLPD